MPARVRWRRALVFNILLASTAVGAQPMRVADIADLSIEELGNIQITSVSKRAERLSDAPAAIFVITGEDIRRSGATRLSEALRLAPNLEVARINSSSYAISARGFNQSSGIANKLLVLIDGRTVYTPLFSGVFWDTQDVMLEDVERIEVISGPGATLWGANAVNGVINVITRRASDTQGAFAYGRAGSLERGLGARYGGAMGAVGSYRVYGRFFDVFNTSRTSGATASDGWSKGQVGFRTDWGTAANGFTLQGDAYRGSLDQVNLVVDENTHISGNNLLGRWNRDLADWGNLQAQAYFDHTERDIPGNFAERLNIFDIDLQHSMRAIGAHRLTWGGGYRYGDDRVSNSAVLAFLPADRRLRWSNVFLQDEIALEDNLRLTLGAKFENNYYTGTEPLPSARLAWKPDPQRLVWGAVSRAVRAPSRIDRDFFIPARTVPTPAPGLDGGPDFVSEVVKVVEAGYRAQPSPQASYSISLFHNIYDKLRSVEPVSATSSVLGNKMEGTTNGLEAWGSYQAASNWRLSAGAFFLRQHLRLKPDSGDTNVSAAGNDPAYQWLLRSSFDLPDSTELDIRVRRVGALPNPSVPDYTAADIRIAWRLQRELELSVVFVDSGHVEFGNPATASEMSSGAYVNLKWTH